jgi:hypothetical protein
VQRIGIVELCLAGVLCRKSTEASVSLSGLDHLQGLDRMMKLLRAHNVCEARDEDTVALVWLM